MKSLLCLMLLLGTDLFADPIPVDLGHLDPISVVNYVYRWESEFSAVTGTMLHGQSMTIRLAFNLSGISNLPYDFFSAHIWLFTDTNMTGMNVDPGHGRMFGSDGQPLTVVVGATSFAGDHVAAYTVYADPVHFIDRQQWVREVEFDIAMPNANVNVVGAKAILRAQSFPVPEPSTLGLLSAVFIVIVTVGLFIRQVLKGRKPANNPLASQNIF